MLAKLRNEVRLTTIQQEIVLQKRFRLRQK